MSDAIPPLSPCSNVLVVDDDPLLCQFLERVLQRKGFRVSFETSGEDALERLHNEDFDVVISDVNMEGLDGLAFTQQVIALRHDTPVILVTGAATMELAITAVRAGAWDFIAKPIDARLLAASIERACEHRQLSKELHHLRAQVDLEDAAVSAW